MFLHNLKEQFHYDQEKDIIYALGCDSKGPKILFIDCKSILNFQWLDITT